MIIKRIKIADVNGVFLHAGHIFYSGFVKSQNNICRSLCRINFDCDLGTSFSETVIREA